jgi:GntR family transcriptional regulator
MTISKAYSYLERDGVVARRPGRPLVVRAQKAEALHDSKREQLRESLRPTVTMIHQLGVGRDEALEVFRTMLADAPEEEES